MLLRTVLYTLLGVGLLQGSDLIPPEVIKKNAHAIDVIVAANFKKNKIPVPETTDDATFMRRAFLVSTGRIPTPKEALQFIELEHPEKRTLLIDYLYNSQGYKSHLINWYYDLFTLREDYGTGPGKKYNGRLIDWFRDAAESNMAWDDLCRNILTSKGNVYETNGASGYFAKGDAVDDHLSNTMRIFTGVRLECAQCHDDPFQEWEQMDFYQLKAFVNGGTSYSGKGNYNKLSGKLRVMEVENPKEYKNNPAGRSYNLLGRLNSVVGHGINESKGTGKVKLPKDYKYSDGDPGEVVAGRAPFGAKLKLSARKDEKEVLERFADWMTSDQTPQFSITISNRLWERVMGISLTPVTGDYVEPRSTNFPKLIEKLSEIMKSYDYDINTFQKTLMSTRTFQFVSSQKDLKNGEKNALDGRRAIRMSAEQIWDSLLSLTVPDPDALPKRKRTELDFIHAGQYLGSKSELSQKINKMSDSEFEKYFFNTYEKLKKKEFPSAAERQAEKQSEMGDSMMASTSRRSSDGVLRRASEMPTPAGGFLSVFGQSQRGAAIDEASKEGTVSQALELLNGQIQQRIVHNSSASVNLVIDQVKGEEERIKTIFLVVLNRVPDAEEMALCLEIVRNSSSPRAAYRNLVGGLISSQEFYFIF